MNSYQEKVLIVDDQDQNLQLIGTVLTMTGYEVILAGSGEQAFNRLAARLPDLILLDVFMPEMNGIEVCRKIKADPAWAEIPVIFLSAADDKNLVVEALECGGVDFVTKPFNKAELLSRVRTHLALRKAREQLRQLAEDKDELLAILTHDLGNHLAGITMSATVLQEQAKEIPPKCAMLVDNILQSTRLIRSFVVEFLANQSAERLVLNAGSVDITGVLKQTITRYAPLAAAKNINISVEVPDRAVYAKADQEGLARVMDNLVSNAIKFSTNGSKVTLQATNVAGWTHFSVRDEGPGFTTEDREKMFRRYGRLSARPTGDELSTGLGLSIVKRLVEDMKGHITLDSEAGKGALFTVRLPGAAGE